MGGLYELKNDAIVLSLNFEPRDTNPKFDLVNIPIQEIRNISIRKKRKMSDRIIIGAASGAAIGAILGSFTKDPHPECFDCFLN